MIRFELLGDSQGLVRISGRNLSVASLCLVLSDSSKDKTFFFKGDDGIFVKDRHFLLVTYSNPQLHG